MPTANNPVLVVGERPWLATLLTRPSPAWGIVRARTAAASRGTAGGAPLSAAAGGGGRTDSAAAVATGRCMEGQGGGSGGSGAHGPLMVDEVEEAALVRRGRHKGIICVFKGCDKYARLSKQGVRR